MTPDPNPSEIKTIAYDYLQKTVRKSGKGGIVYLPESWVGRKVQVLLIEPTGDE